MTTYIRHPLVRPLTTEERWPNPSPAMEARRCAFTAAGKRRQCKSDATMMALARDREDHLPACYVHALVYIEHGTTDLITDADIYRSSPPSQYWPEDG